MSESQAKKTREDIPNISSKMDFESDLIEAALKSAVNDENTSEATQKKYIAINERIKHIKKPQEAQSKPLTSGVIDKKELDWEIGFTPHNFENLVIISGVSSNTSFYTKYDISKTVFYSYMRGDTSPSYRYWKVLVDAVLRDSSAKDKDVENNI